MEQRTYKLLDDLVLARLHRTPLGSRLAARLLERVVSGKTTHGLPIGFARRLLGDALNIRIDPTQITHHANSRLLPGKKTRIHKLCFVSDGPWDSDPLPIAQVTNISEIFDLIDNGLRYEETESYARRVQAVADGTATKMRGQRVDTPERVHAYFQRQVDLIRSIESNGYRSRDEARHLEANITTVGGAKQERKEAEVGCAVGREGRLLFNRIGKHRFAAAVKLGIRNIPAQINLVHSVWIARIKERLGCSALDALKSGLAHIETPDGDDSTPLSG